MNTDELVIRLSPGVSFSVDGQARPHARIQRGASITHFAIDRSIQTFLECFRTPLTLSQAADALAGQGFERGNVLSFGKSLLKTPLLEFHDASLAIPEAGAALATLGLDMLAAFKDRKFDGVYHVRDEAGQDAVVKLLRAPAHLAESERILRRMENEVAVLGRLAAVPAVVKIGSFARAPHPHFRMEFVGGAPMTGLIMGRSTLARRLGLARDAVAVMAQVHACGVIHGDLHTSNFMVDLQGALRLIDFDCSFVADGGYIPRIGGAVHFMPPERMCDSWHSGSDVAPDFSSDMYQLGVIVYFILRGVPPFRGKQFAELTAAVRDGNYAPLRTTAEGESLPPALCAAVHACLAFLPGERPASPAAILPHFPTEP